MEKAYILYGFWQVALFWLLILVPFFIQMRFTFHIIYEMLKDFNVFKAFDSTPECFRNKFERFLLMRRLKCYFFFD
jgi:hypothetical protein